MRKRCMLLLSDTAYYATDLYFPLPSAFRDFIRISEKLRSPGEWRKYFRPSDASSRWRGVSELAIDDFRWRSRPGSKTSVLASTY